MENLCCSRADVGFTDRHINGIRLFEVVMPPGSLIIEHAHSRPHACLVVQGSLKDRDLGRSQELHEGGLRLSPGGDRHHLGVGPEGAACFLVIGPDGSYAAPERRVYGTDTHETDIAFELRRHLLGEEEFIQPTIQGQVAELFARGNRLSRPRTVQGIPNWVVESRCMIERELESPPSLMELARAVGVHRVHLARAFRDHFGCTVGAYLRRVQVNAARELVLFTTTPLCEVAIASGHADQAHMTRRFREAFGSTPAAMRASTGAESSRSEPTCYSRSRQGH